MIRKYRIPGILIVSTGILLISSAHTLSGRDIPESELDTFRLVNDFVDENDECFRCHGEDNRCESQPVFRYPTSIS